MRMGWDGAGRVIDSIDIFVLCIWVGLGWVWDWIGQVLYWIGIVK